MEELLRTISQFVQGYALVGEGVLTENYALEIAVNQILDPEDNEPLRNAIFDYACAFADRRGITR